MEIFEPLRNIGEPILDLSEPMPYEMLHNLITQMYPWGRKYSHRSVYVNDLDDQILDIVTEQSKAAPSDLSAVGI